MNITTSTPIPIPPVPIDPPIGKCNYYINGNDSVVVFDFSVRYGGIPQNLLINLLSFLVLMILFSVLRRAAGNYGRLALVRKRDDLMQTGHPAPISKWTELFFSPDDVGAAVPSVRMPTRRRPSAESGSSMDYGSVAAAEEALAAEDKSFFAWVWKIFTLTDDKFLRKCGPDAVQYIRFQRHLIFLTAVMTVVCICLILPINFQGNVQGDAMDFGHTTISNLNGTDERIWIHVIVVILFFPLGILIMRRFSVSLQINEQIDEQEGLDDDVSDTREETISARTLMIAGIPPGYCTKEMLCKHFMESYPEHPVEEVQPAYDVSKLAGLDDKRERARKARLYCESYAAQNGAGQQMCPHTCGIVWMKCDDGCGFCCGCRCCRSVDALTFYTREEQALKQKVEREKAKVKTKSIGVAFVTFGSAQSANAVAKDHAGTTIWAWCLPWRRHSRKSSVSNLLDPHRWRVRVSPPPDDIYWENLGELHRLFFLKTLFINILVFVVLFFFTSPTYIISQMELIVNLKTITSKLHLSEKINDFLPTLMLWTLSALLPIIVAYSDWWLGHWKRSAENLWIMRKVFFYLLFMVLILPSIGLTSLRALVEFVIHNNPTDKNSTMTWNCIFLPDNGAFFVNYAVTSSLVGVGLEFMRFSELLMYALRMCVARSVAEIASVRKANLYEYPFGFNYSWMLLIFALTAAYGVVCPLITPFGLFYLIMKHGVDRYNIFYAYKRSKISKQIHATAVNCVIVSLLLQQLVLLFFNIIRGQVSDASGSVAVLPARAIFSITMFTIFTAMFFGQIFFHMFLGVSPIQYTTAASPNLRTAATQPTDSSSEAAEMVFGEFGNFERTDLDLQTRQRRRRLRSTKCFVPEVLRTDVFCQRNQENNVLDVDESGDATFNNVAQQCGAIDQQPSSSGASSNV